MLTRLVDAGDADSAVAVALEIERLQPDFAVDSLPAFLTRFSVVTTTPAGATVCRASFADTTQWRCLGTTPTDSLWLPNRPVSGLWPSESCWVCRPVTPWLKRPARHGGTH